IEQVNLRTVEAGRVGIGDGSSTGDRIDGNPLHGLTDGNGDVRCAEKGKGGVGTLRRDNRIVHRRVQRVGEAVAVQNSLDGEYAIEIRIVLRAVRDVLNQDRTGISGIQ